MGKTVTIILSCIVLIVLASNFAQATVIFNTTYKTGSSMTINGTVYSVVVAYGNSTGAVLKDGNLTIGFALGECQDFFDQMLCYVDKDDTQGRFTLFDQNAFVELDREISENTELNVGEPVYVNVTLNNTGRTTARDIIFEDILPEGYLVDEIEGCRHEGNIVTWTGNLLSGSYTRCTYVLVGGREAAGILRGNVSYLTITGIRTAGLEEIELSATVPDWVDVVVSPEEIRIGEDVNIRINFTTNETFNLSLKRLEIPLSDNFVFKEASYRNLKMDGNVITLNKNIMSNTTLILDINVTAINAGTLPLNVTVIFTPDGDPIEFVHEFEIESQLDPLVVSIEPDTGNILEPYLESHILIYVQNTNPFYEISSYNIDVKSDLFGLETGRRDVTVSNSHGKRIVYDAYYTVPVINKSSKAYISAIVKGTDGLMTEVSGSTNLTISLLPLGEITIRKELNHSTRDGKNISEITVYVSSTYGRRISNLKIEDAVPEEFYYRGTPTMEISIGAGETIKAYSYELSVPYTMDSFRNYNISTIATYTYANKEFSTIGDIMVDSGEIHAFLHPSLEEAPPIAVLLPEETKGGLLLLFVIFDILVFILVIMYFFGINVIRIVHMSFHHIYSDKKHSRILKKNEEFKKQVELLTDEEKKIFGEEKQLEIDILDVTKQIEKENHVLPKKVGLNDKKIEKLDHAFAKVQSKRDILSEKMDHLKKEDDTFTGIQEELSKRKEGIVQRNQDLAAKKIKLVQDMDTMRGKLIALTSSVDKMKISKGKIENDWVTLKKSHLDTLFSKIGKIEEKEKDIRDREKELLLQKRLINEEQKEVKKTLNISHNRPAE